MFIILTILLAVNLAVVEIHACHFHSKVNVTAAFKCDKVQPDVVDTSPKELLTVQYKCGKSAQLGNELTPTEVKNVPYLDWLIKHNALYTLTMTDPDAPSDEREFLHWLVVNIREKDVGRGDHVVEYIGSGPPKGSGKHRYTFLIFQQPGRIYPDEPRANRTTADGRAQFNTKKFAQKYNLGDPVAGNFYKAQWDEYVPVLEHQLGF